MRLWGRRITIDDAGMNGPASVFRHQLHCSISAGNGQFGVQAFLEAAGCIGTQSKFYRGTPHTRSLEICRFQQHGGRVVIDFADCAAHDTGNGDWTLWISDKQHIGLQFAFYAIEGDYLLTRPGTAHNNMMMTHQIVVKTVQRLAELQHDVVGDIDDVIDRSHACRQQSPPHPFKRRTDLDVADNTGTVARAEIGVLYRHLYHLRGGFPLLV